MRNPYFLELAGVALLGGLVACSPGSVTAPDGLSVPPGDLPEECKVSEVDVYFSNVDGRGVWEDQLAVGVMGELRAQIKNERGNPPGNTCDYHYSNYEWQDYPNPDYDPHCEMLGQQNKPRRTLQCRSGGYTMVEACVRTGPGVSDVVCGRRDVKVVG